jgi:sulfoxide reductase heme-binding subunit YedZ
VNLLLMFSHWFPVWNTTRAAGFVSYLLLFFSMMAGLLQSFRFLGTNTRSVALVIHSTCGWLGFLFGMVHGLVLLFDKQVPYSFTEIFVPFASPRAMLPTACGILAFYILFFLVLTSDLMKQLGRKIWRAIHYLAFPGYVLALYHGIALGTDTQSISIQIVYGVTGAVTFSLIVARILLSIQSGKRSSWQQ